MTVIRTPRPHQVKGIDQLRVAYRAGHKWVCVVMPTGAGKTHLGAFVIKSHLEKNPNAKVLWLTHRDELVGQGVDSIEEHGILCGVIQANASRTVNRYRKVQVASIQTLIARDIFIEGVTLVVYDECHHSQSAEWSQLALRYKRTGALGLGLTATPIRADGLPMGDIYDEIVAPITMEELIKQGFLCDYDLRQPPRTLKPKELAQSPFNAWKAEAQGHKSIVFASNVRSATTFAEEFTGGGVSAAVITGTMKTGERREILRKYKSGKIQVLANCGVLTEGFDDPATSCVILARLIGSVGLYLQMTGRALRTHPGKSGAIIIDLAGSSWKHGAPDDDRQWSLDGDGVRGKKVELAPERFCPVCGATMGPEDQLCGECGTEGKGMTIPEIKNLPLVKYAKMRKKSDDEKVVTLRKWLALAEAKGHKIGATMHKYKAVFGEWPSDDIVRSAKRSVPS